MIEIALFLAHQRPPTAVDMHEDSLHIASRVGLNEPAWNVPSLLSRRHIELFCVFE